MKWTVDNTPNCRLRREPSGFLGFVFDERFQPQYEEDVRQQIVLIKRQHDEGASFRWIAENAGLSLSRVYRLYKLWRRDLDRADDFAWEEESEPPAVADGFTPDEDFDDDTETA